MGCGCVGLWCEGVERGRDFCKKALRERWIFSISLEYHFRSLFSSGWSMISWFAGREALLARLFYFSLDVYFVTAHRFSH